MWSRLDASCSNGLGKQCTANQATFFVLEFWNKATRLQKQQCCCDFNRNLFEFVVRLLHEFHNRTAYSICELNYRACHCCVINIWAKHGGTHGYVTSPTTTLVHVIHTITLQNCARLYLFPKVRRWPSALLWIQRTGVFWYRPMLHDAAAVTFIQLRQSHAKYIPTSVHVDPRS